MNGIVLQDTVTINLIFIQINKISQKIREKRRNLPKNEEISG